MHRHHAALGRSIPRTCQVKFSFVLLLIVELQSSSVIFFFKHHLSLFFFVGLFDSIYIIIYNY